ncbi:MAG: BCCT family transporter [Pyrinomonadaceae bacterium]|nr:BCCT family transporter [Pyrinomonadaceae bacterium]
MWVVFLPTNFDSVTRAMLGFVVQNLSWLYMIMATCFLVFVVVLALSRYGRIKLGKAALHHVSSTRSCFRYRLRRQHTLT